MEKIQKPDYIAGFDSATGLLEALSNCLHHKSFAGVGKVPSSKLLGKLVNALPWQLQSKLYLKSSAKGSVPEDDFEKIDAESIGHWVTSLFPEKKYPVIFIGSANGALIYMAAAMGVPWLPQTFLVPVSTPEHFSVDDPAQRMQWAQPIAEEFLARNPALQLHHMMDPNSDRPVLNAISYFRIKIIHLLKSYADFIERNLKPGGTIFLVDCQKRWPVTAVGERHYFQFGGAGGIDTEEYMHGSPRIQKFLQQHDAAVENWKAPDIDTEQPESEWGFVQTLGDDIKSWAADQSFSIQTISFTEPADMSPFVADLHRWWYQKFGVDDSRLLAGMFFLMEPYYTLRGALVPYWLTFNDKVSLEFFERYLKESKNYAEIYIMPFSNGVSTIGMAQVEDYRRVIKKASNKGQLLGTDPSQYPFDFGIYTSYEKQVKDIAGDRHFEEILSLEDLRNFLDAKKGDYEIAWQ